MERGSVTMSVAELEALLAASVAVMMKVPVVVAPFTSVEARPKVPRVLPTETAFGSEEVHEDAEVQSYTEPLEKEARALNWYDVPVAMVVVEGTTDNPKKFSPRRQLMRPRRAARKTTTARPPYFTVFISHFSS